MGSLVIKSSSPIMQPVTTVVEYIVEKNDGDGKINQKKRKREEEYVGQNKRKKIGI